jgi:sugar lactone lactonase YvrE
VLVWQGLFTVNAAAGALTLRNGKAATFALGQATLGASHANRGLGAPTSSSLSSPGGLAIDSGRLAVADTGNHRVLIFGSLPTSVSTLPSTVLGQSGFGAGLANRGGVPAADTLSAPRDVFLSSTISINGSTGALLVADTGNHRVLVYQAFAPATGAAADVALGQTDLVSGDPAVAATRLHSPSGVTADPTTGRIYVADTGSHRVMTYNAGGALATGAAGVAIGQASAAVGDPNRGGAPSASTLNGPGAVEIGGTALIVADSLNHRILIYEGASLPTADVPATVVLGQSSFTGATPEARRLNQPSDALVVDGRLVLSDTANHRVLIYNTIPLSGDPDPDVVLGQADLFSTQANRGVTPDADTLDSPTSVATDGTRLVVADTGNNRVLIWSALPTATGTAADIILGQPSATESQPNTGTAASARTFHSPEGVAIDSDRLIVADRDNHRVLIFTGLSAISAFAEATSVLGQPRFDEVEPNRDESVRGDTMRSPRDVLVGKGRLYVADSGNHRVLVWNKVPSGSGSSADGLFGQSTSTSAMIAGASADSLVEPSGLAMDPGGEFLVVSDTAHNRVVFFDSVTGKSGSDRSASSVLGQPTLVTGSPKEPGPATLDSPRGLFFNGYELYAADAGTSRLTVYR